MFSRCMKFVGYLVNPWESQRFIDVSRYLGALKFQYLCRMNWQHVVHTIELLSSLPVTRWHTVSLNGSDQGILVSPQLRVDVFMASCLLTGC